MFQHGKMEIDHPTLQLNAICEEYLTLLSSIQLLRWEQRLVTGYMMFPAFKGSIFCCLRWASARIHTLPLTNRDL